MQSFRKCLALVWILVLFLVSACEQKTLQPMRVGTNIWPGYEPLYLARELDYLDNNAVRLVEYSAATEVIRAFRNGAIDAAALTLDEVLLLAQHGHNPRIVLIMDFSDGGDAVVGRSELLHLSDLKGQRVGVEENALGAYMLQRALDKAGLSIADIEIVPLTVSQHEHAFDNKEVDAVVTFDPVRRKLLQRDANELFNSSQIPGEIVDVLVVREDYLKNHPGAVSKLLAGWFRALGYLQQEPEKSAEIMAQREGISAAEFSNALTLLRIPDLQENRDKLVGQIPELYNVTEKLQSVMLDQKLQTHPVMLQDLFGNGHLLP